MTAGEVLVLVVIAGAALVLAAWIARGGRRRPDDLLPRHRPEELSAAERSRDAFLSAISHELRTPLTSVLSGIEILRDYAGADPQSRDEFLRIMEQESRRMLGLVEQIVDLGKVGRHKLKLQVEPCDLAELLDQVAAGLGQRFLQAGVELRRIRPAATPYVADRTRLAQALKAMLEHALVRSRRGGTVEVELQSSKAEHVFRVADDGPVLSAQQRESLFTGWHAACTEDGKWDRMLALDLPLGSRVAELHGGRLECTAPTCGGACLRLHLPSQPAARAPAAIPELVG
jgi:two-component system phosphate regulon sensor histidine kinase PhoR